MQQQANLVEVLLLIVVKKCWRFLLESQISLSREVMGKPESLDEGDGFSVFSVVFSGLFEVDYFNRLQIK